MEHEGVSFEPHKTREAEFIGGRDKWFPAHRNAIGPDGALYILDFYNQAGGAQRHPRNHPRPANAALRPDRTIIRPHLAGGPQEAKKIAVPI